MSGGTIFGLTPFEPKRILILPSQGGEITLYVLDGLAYPAKVLDAGSPTHKVTHKVIECVHFGGWIAGFRNSKFNTYLPHVIVHDGLEHCELEVAFRLVPSKSSGQTAEIVAVSTDGGKTFFENELCTLPSEYAE